MPTLLFFFFFHFKWFYGFFSQRTWLSQLRFSPSLFLHGLEENPLGEAEENSFELSCTFASSQQSKEVITWEAEKLYHESLFNKTFIAEHDILDSNVHFTFMFWDQGWTTFYTQPQPRISPAVRELQSNLKFRLGTTVYVRGKWVDFSATMIN